MAVGHERVISEIEKHTRQARKGDAAKMRESLAAIRALCDLLLEGEDQPTAPAPAPRSIPLSASPAPRSIPLSASPAPQPVLSEKKLVEEGANGDSLFEF